MSIEKFITNDELVELISDRSVKGNDLREVLREKGIFLIESSPSGLSDLVIPHIFGASFTSKLQDRLICDQNNLKSTVVILNEVPSCESSDFLANLSDKFAKLSRTNSSKNAFNTSCNLKNNTLSIEYSFNKRQKGRRSLIEMKKVSMQINVSPLVDGKYKASILHEGATEAKNFIELLEDIVKQEDLKDAIFQINRITLDKLTKNHKIDLFDNFGSHSFREWTLVSITNVSVDYYPDEIPEPNDDEAEVQNPYHPDTQSQLAGISSAVLTGHRLRDNDFIKSCTQEGFIFNSMRYRFEHKEEPISLEVDISFKQKDLKIMIYKSYRREDDGRDYIFVLPKYQQKEYLDQFQDIFYEIYRNFIETQRNNLDVK